MQALAYVLIHFTAQGYLHKYSISTKIHHSLNLTGSTYIRNPLGSKVA